MTDTGNLFEIDEEIANLRFWQDVFKHMHDWRVVGWTRRSSVQVLDEFDKSHSYTYAMVRPILALKYG